MSVNDPFVMQAWGKTQHVPDGLQMLADGNADLAGAPRITRLFDGHLVATWYGRGTTGTDGAIAKAAIERDLLFARPYFPVPDMVPDGLAVSRALALSITRMHQLSQRASSHTPPA